MSPPRLGGDTMGPPRTLGGDREEPLCIEFPGQPGHQEILTR